MEITRNNWRQYIQNLAKADDKAAEMVTSYLQSHEIASEAGFQAFVDFYHAVVTKYAEGASEMAAQAYEALADAQGATIKSAMPAETPSREECAKTIRGTMLDSDQVKSLAQTAGRLVRRTGVDTTINNALRDGAEWAWVPSGDTCAFCMMLASNGWQRASKKAIKNGHASHIHANCDCTYAIRFDGKSTVEGYDPDYYKSLYDNAEGTRWQDKLNSMRRDKYAQNKDKINAQKRAAYAKRRGIKSLRKAITIESFDEIKSLVGDNVKDAKYHIADEIIDCISGRLVEKGAMGNFESIRVTTLKEGVLFDTNLVQNGTWYKCELRINGQMLDGCTLKQIQNRIRKNKKTVCKTLEECVDHEIAHSKQARGALASVVDRLNETEGIASISEVASEDMLETLAEVSILKDKGLYDTITLSEEERRIIDSAAKELGVW